MILETRKEKNSNHSHNNKKMIKLNIILIVICLAVLAATTQHFFKEFKYFRLIRGSDEITRLEEKFSRIKYMLPPNGVIGYYSDQPHDSFTLSVARYSLSPRIIELDSNQTIIIGNFSQQSILKKYAEANSLYIVKKIDKNIVLFRKGID